MQTILSENQKRLLDLLGREKTVTDNFYLSGGTALAEFYLRHRYSEDLDFFSENEFDPMSISVVLKKIGSAAGTIKVEQSQHFNMNLFFLDLKDGDKIKTEFTYFPFARIEEGTTEHGIRVDSLTDIAVNKIFTIYQKPRSRDFIDLFFILKENPNFSVDELSRQAQVKFDSYLSPVQLGAQYLKASELKDYPRMIKKIDDEEWQNYFLEEAKKLKDRVIE